MIKDIFYLFSLLGLMSYPLSAQETTPKYTIISEKNSPPYQSKLGEYSFAQQKMVLGLPILALALPYNWVNNEVRAIRNNYIPHFKHPYDDYLQFAPLVTQLGLRSFGQVGHSQHWGELLTADALSLAIMFTTVSLGKRLSYIERPDGSAHNSFPSGHTAMAFTAASLLSLEYGRRYPALATLGYLSAGAVGIGRILNNRHWTGDVVMGTHLGIVSAELAYWLTSLIYRRPYNTTPSLAYLKDIDLRLSLPWFVGIARGVRGGGLGLGVRYVLPKSNYFIQADWSYEAYPLSDTRQSELIEFAHSNRIRLGWGKTWQELLHTNSSLDIATSFVWENDCLYPSVQLIPRWQFTPRLSYIIGLGYSYRPLASYPRSLKSNLDLTVHRFYLNSGFELRL